MTTRMGNPDWMDYNIGGKKACKICRECIVSFYGWDNGPAAENLYQSKYCMMPQYGSGIYTELSENCRGMAGAYKIIEYHKMYRSCLTLSEYWNINCK